MKVILLGFATSYPIEYQYVALGGGNQTTFSGFNSGEIFDITFFIKYQEYVIALIVYSADECL
ncbi:hypothetical protein E4T81_13335 [Barnesiella sp. WM24]|uniref:hypothetical protein n=1 Tax=Barnesiella sp. WM24 TaxID=2558278 RepID=UPI001071BA4C|nr:hypothetical protein [Barnesiella sp. WM24]TFU92090.1 hypothetical protein E4T81_13335 [Barnesiella sp. WM24]